jgi:membrane protease YdiL (CAAX protease family)
MTERKANSAILAIGLVLALILPLFGHYAAPYIPTDRLTASSIFFWALAVLVLLYVVVVERRPLSSIGLKAPGLRDLVFAGLAAGVAAVGMTIIFSVVFPALHLKLASTSANTALLAAPFWVRFMTVLRAAVTEEILFRGYGMERLGQWSKSMWLAALVTCAIFTYAHISGWGLPIVLIAGWGGIVLTLFYLWRRNLWANILLHWLVDAVGFLLIPALAAHH